MGGEKWRPRETGGVTETKLKSENITSAELRLLALVCLFCILSAVIMIDWSISEASNFDGRGSEDKVCCYCRRLSRCVSTIGSSIRDSLIRNNSKISHCIQESGFCSRISYSMHCAPRFHRSNIFKVFI